MHRRIIRSIAALAAAAAWITAVAEARAQGGLIRDAEIEHISRSLATPLFAAAGLVPGDVEIHIIDDHSINAFVSGGQKVFLNTGLLLAVQTPGHLIGVLAHETGHVAGGHLAQTQEALRRANVQTVVAFLLGAAAIAGGADGDAGFALLLGGQQIAEQGFLQYSRAQESAADQAALELILRTGQSPRGLVEFLGIVGRRKALLEGRVDPYLLSHPLFPDRMTALEERAAAAPPATRPPAVSEAAFERMQAKLFGFLTAPDQVLRRYPPGDAGTAARYARAIAYHRAGRLDESLAEIEALLDQAPADPYFHELMGQVLLERGRVAEALAPYAQAVALAPGQPLLRLGLARALLATEDPALIPAAIEHLRRVTTDEPKNAGAWRQLAIAFGRNGDLGLSALASAEQYLAVGRAGDSRRHAEQALGRLAEGSPGWIRAQDIMRAAENL